MSNHHPNAHAEFDRVNNIVILTLNGDLDIELLALTLDKTDEYLSELSENGLPPIGFADARGLLSIKLEARRHGVEWLRTANYKKFAVYGDNLFVKYFVNGLIKVLGNPMRYFTSRDEAIAWLKEE
ncbi:MAG: STAS/SEC14 domain-containing protein [Flavobacteriales bacterium]